MAVWFWAVAHVRLAKIIYYSSIIASTIGRKFFVKRRKCFIFNGLEGYDFSGWLEKGVYGDTWKLRKRTGKWLRNGRSCEGMLGA